MIVFSSIIFPRLLKEHDARKVVIHVKHVEIITFVEEKLTIAACKVHRTGADLGEGCRGCAPPSEMTCGLLIQLVFCKKKKLCGLWVLK